MLLLRGRLGFSIFIVSSLCQVFASYKPIRFFPPGNETIRKEGKILKIRCKSYTPLQYICPNVAGESINTSKYYTYYSMENGRYDYTFNRSKTVFGDTGWYSCVDHSFGSSTNSYDFDFSSNSYDSETDWFYVFVKSDTNLFVKADTNVHLNATIGGSVVIPCRTTSPDLKPVLINGNEDELEVPFDPKSGFTIRNLSLEDSNSYKCLLEKDGEKHTVSYVLSVLKEAISKLKIRVNDLFVTRGQDLKINCTVEKKSKDCEFDWKMPREDDSRRNVQQFIERLDESVLITSELTIFNVTDEDTGNYKCIVSTIYETTEITKNIKIYDPQIKRITLVHNFNSSYIRRNSGSSVLLNILVYTVLDTYTQWFKPNGEAIIEDSKDIVMTESYNSLGLENFQDPFEKTVSNLEIISLNVLHSGNYTIQAKNGYAVERLNFTLDVIDKPSSILTHIDSNYLFNETVEFRCEITSNPPPNVKWSFLKCPNYPSVENSTIVHLTKATQNAANNSNYIFESIVKMPIEMSGKITCEACNNLGCDSKTEKITASVPVPPFFNETNMNQTETKIVDVAESQNTVILRCVAEGMPKPTLTWYKDNVMLNKSDQYFFLHNRQELHIKYLILDDSGNYSCRADNSIGTNETYQWITVKDTKWNTSDILLVTSKPILGFSLIILAIYFTIRIHREKRKRKELMETGLLNFEEGTLESLNPNLTVDEQAELLPYDKKWEFPRERLKLKEQLNSGQFGVVMKAEAIGICKNENVATVAVKMIRQTSNPIYIHALVNELKIMVHLGEHLNIINLLGACTKNVSKCELLVIFEYCHFGNLRNYLLKHRNHFINQIDPKTKKFDFTIGKDMLTRTININNDSLNTNSDTDTMVHYYPKTDPNSSEVNFLPNCILNSNSCQSEERSNHFDKDQNHKSICTQDLLSWAFQVARGMEYLSQRKILHGDLAARNVLLAEDNLVKICDFGLAKNICKDGIYKKSSDALVPVKWMAIESIRDRVFSTQSDVWSFGVMLWEFFTLAKTPYPDMETEEQYQKLIEGYRLEQPDYAVDEVYDIMLQCWIAKPTLRPSFSDLMESMGNLLEESVRMHYIILNNPYVDINMINLKNRKDDYLMKMPAPDHAVLSDYKRMNSLSKVFHPISHKDQSHIEFLSPTTDSENLSDLPPMLKHEENPYLKPINVQERRTEFARRREAMKNNMVNKIIGQNSVYYNMLRNSLHRSE